MSSRGSAYKWWQGAGKGESNALKKEMKINASGTYFRRKHLHNLENPTYGKKKGERR